RNHHFRPPFGAPAIATAIERTVAMNDARFRDKDDQLPGRRMPQREVLVLRACDPGIKAAELIEPRVRDRRIRRCAEIAHPCRTASLRNIAVFETLPKATERSQQSRFRQTNRADEQCPRPFAMSFEMR